MDHSLGFFPRHLFTSAVFAETMKHLGVDFELTENELTDPLIDRVRRHPLKDTAGYKAAT